jgi:hypothetical protein
MDPRMLDRRNWSNRFELMAEAEATFNLDVPFRCAQRGSRWIAARNQRFNIVVLSQDALRICRGGSGNSVRNRGATKRACARIGLRLRARLNEHGIVDRSTASQRGVVAGAGFELARLVRHIGTYAWTRSNRTGLSLECLHTAHISADRAV